MPKFDFEILREKRYNATGSAKYTLTAIIPSKYLHLENIDTYDLDDWFTYYDTDRTLDLDPAVKQDLDFIYDLFEDWIEAARESDTDEDSDIELYYSNQKALSDYRRKFFKTHTYAYDDMYYKNGSELDAAKKLRSDAWTKAYNTGEDTRKVYKDRSFFKDVPLEKKGGPTPEELLGLKVSFVYVDNISFDGYYVPDSWEEPGYGEDNAEEVAGEKALSQEKDLKNRIHKIGCDDISIDVSYDIDFDSADYDYTDYRDY